MRAKDLIEKAKSEFANKFLSAISSGDENALAEAMSSFSEALQEAMMQEYRSTQQDSAVLAARGVRVLTSQEQAYYNALMGAMSDSNPKMAIEKLDVAMPETIIDAVMDDIESDFPLLREIDFRNTTGITKWIYNTQGTQLAKWGPLGSEITKELDGSMDIMDMQLNKLTAFMVVNKDFLALGPAWLDRYVRAIIAEANGLALETAIVDGDGKECPIGMTRDLSKGTTDTGKTTYQQKDAITVTEFTPAVYGDILSRLAKTPTGRERKVRNVLMVVSPTDYLKKIMPATTILTPQGTYVSDVLPFPTTIVQSVGVPVGKAVVGLGYRYFMGIGANKKGVIEYSDHVQFLEDNRVYTTHLYGNGRPLDNVSFVLLDISNLEAPIWKVEAVENP